jgi:tetratricopeptide (TPR) repeat protein
MELDELSKEYVYRRAIAAKYLDRRDEELSWLNKTLNKGFHLKALKERFRLETWGGDYQAALDYYGWLWKHQPAAWATIYKAKALLGLGRLDEALAECNKVLVDGNEGDRYNWHYVTRARVYLALGEDEKAYYDLAWSTAKEKPSSEALLRLGDYFMEQSPDYAKAISYYTAVIVNEEFRVPDIVPEDKRHEPSSSRLRRARAYIALDAGRFADDGLDDLARYIELRPDDAEGYAERAGLYMQLGEREKAMADLRKAVELDADNEEYRERLDRLQHITDVY